MSGEHGGELTRDEVLRNKVPDEMNVSGGCHEFIDGEHHVNVARSPARLAERTQIATEKHMHGAPDLVVEILSESKQRTDEIVKRSLCERFGAREYCDRRPGARVGQGLPHRGRRLPPHRRAR